MIDPAGHPGTRRGVALGFSFSRVGTVMLLPALISILSACTPMSRIASEPHPSLNGNERSAGGDAAVSNVEHRIRAEVAEWAGSPYVLGGTTANGIDCSAFVQSVYRDALNLPLPRTTREQVRTGKAVNRRDLRPGDLVFFRPPTKVRHVGIYLNDGEFAHASTSQGVTISDLDQEYWNRAYWTSRRILSEAERPALADRPRPRGRGSLPHPDPGERAGESTTKRIGW